MATKEKIEEANEEMADLEFEGVETQENDAEKPDTDELTMESPDWTGHVMSLLTKDEKIGDKPKALGLLRIAPIAYGEEIASVTKDVHCVSPEYAAVTTTILFEDGFSICGSAEVSEKNCGEPYNNFPLASASTRALGRALKLALRLQVLTAEENNDIALATSSDDMTASSSITDVQIKFIDILCGPKKLNANVREVVSLILGREVESIKTLTHEESVTIQGKLDSWANNKEDKPENLGEYDSDWQSNFA